MEVLLKILIYKDLNIVEFKYELDPEEAETSEEEILEPFRQEIINGYS